MIDIIRDKERNGVLTQILDRLFDRCSGLKRTYLLPIPIGLRLVTCIGVMVLIGWAFWPESWNGFFVLVLPCTYVFLTAPFLFLLDIPDSEMYQFRLGNCFLIILFKLVAITYLILLIFDVLSGDWSDYAMSAAAVVVSYILARDEFRTAYYLEQMQEDEKLY